MSATVRGNFPLGKRFSRLLHFQVVDIFGLPDEYSLQQYGNDTLHGPVLPAGEASIFKAHQYQWSCCSAAVLFPVKTEL